MTRVMVNLDNKTGRALKAKAKADNRSLSSYVSVLIDRDVNSEAARLEDELIAAGRQRGMREAIDAIVRDARKGKAA